MSSHSQFNPSELDLFLDGQLDLGRRTAFEALLARDPQLRAEAQAQRMIDASLSRSFVPPAPPVIPVPKPELDKARPTAPQGTGWRLSLGWTAVAASLAVAFAGWQAWSFTREFFPPLVTANTSDYSMEIFYHMSLSARPPNLWQCDSDKQFATAFWKHLGQGLMVRRPPANVSFGGIAYAHVLSPDSIVLLSHVDNTQVLVFADRLASDTHPELEAGCGLNLFRREFGSLVVYELSSFDKPRLIDLFYIPDMPAEWIK